eukprot:468510-Rhodomonas_salina.1
MGWRTQRPAAQGEYMKLPSVVTWFTKPKASPERIAVESTPDRKQWSLFDTSNDSLQTSGATALSRNTTPKVLTKSPFSFSPLNSTGPDDDDEPTPPRPPPRSPPDEGWSSKPSVITWAENGFTSGSDGQISERIPRHRESASFQQSPRRPATDSGEYPLAFLTLQPSPHVPFNGECSRMVLEVPFVGEEANDLNKIVRAMEWGGHPTAGGRLNPRRVVAERVLGGTLKVQVRVDESSDDGQLGSALVATAMEARVAAAAVLQHQEALQQADALPPPEVREVVKEV